ncbi:ABC-type bacteriocin/lantibiotic exporter with double-glycine peptidase domain [Arcanobacterium wilhelmae]|uniref:ABC-type bacteriocin/lantibiotic exporter with double-glycine peptidase domain n=1 Tax=Arcanobacterium wilhelmae TaxID=1803177 RepID=A0ABT9NCT1_9ACTO|nr:ABC transporter ATP-binding protein [Arcanobacterium wilhelmae]MDP9801315.1 ABC-type bacteriocin/lantibiotic exporter with double-glycine peptidase domain [Arcanobacterium wilhelmae]WFN90656.1 ABC transporter ATP-binding protein [Arcanobacterium wilhelmae]
MRQKKTTPASINLREFEVGPAPRFPHWMSVDSIPTYDPANPIRSTITQNWRLLTIASLAQIAVFVGSALIPWALGILLDSGIERGLTAALIPGSLLLLAVILFRAAGALAESLSMLAWMRANFGWQKQMVDALSSARDGGREKMPTGEAVAAPTTDSQKVGSLMYGITNAFGAACAFIVIAVLMLLTDLTLGLIVVIGLPLTILAMARMVRPLQEKLDANRKERGALTTLAADAVAGLRVLRGVGGEDIYNERYAAQSAKVEETGIDAARLQATLFGLNAAIPAVFAAVIVGLGIAEVVDGTLTIGSLVAFYGYSAYLVVPVSTATQMFQGISDARVAADRIAKVATLTPLTSDAAADPTLHPRWELTALTDTASGVSVAPGRLTVLVCANPAQSAALAERLARVSDEHEIRATWPAGSADGGSADAGSADAGAPASDAGTSLSDAGAAGSLPGTVTADLRHIPLAEVRENLVLSDAVAQIFQGRLRSNLNAGNAERPVVRTIAQQMGDVAGGNARRSHEESPGAASDEELTAALDVADAADIVEGLERGLDGQIAERGRDLSGGQRQRVALARAVLTRAPILVLVEPTSAVDSHTETRISQRLAMARAGLTTVVVSASPIVLGMADEVVLVGTPDVGAPAATDEPNDAGANDASEPTGVVELARGTHEELLADPRYRAIVHRAAGEETTEEATR